MRQPSEAAGTGTLAERIEELGWLGAGEMRVALMMSPPQPGKLIDLVVTERCDVKPGCRLDRGRLLHTGNQPLNQSFADRGATALWGKGADHFFVQQRKVFFRGKSGAERVEGNFVVADDARCQEPPTTGVAVHTFVYGVT